MSSTFPVKHYCPVAARGGGQGGNCPRAQRLRGRCQARAEIIYSIWSRMHRIHRIFIQFRHVYITFIHHVAMYIRGGGAEIALAPGRHKPSRRHWVSPDAISKLFNFRLRNSFSTTAAKLFFQQKNTNTSKNFKLVWSSTILLFLVYFNALLHTWTMYGVKQWENRDKLLY